jgi:hypothetical protein
MQHRKGNRDGRVAKQEEEEEEEEEENSASSIT